MSACATKVFAIAANMMECAPADLELRNGKVGVVGVPGMEVTLASVAQAARPGWDHRRPAGIDAGLEESFYWEPPTVTWSNATHIAVVEVDITSGQIGIDQYVVAHDCGVVINPMLVEGQIVGGTVQGLGGALFEEFVYDQQGQLLTGSLMDYALPRASDIPRCNCSIRNSRLRSIPWVSRASARVAPLLRPPPSRMRFPTHFPCSGPNSMPRRSSRSISSGPWRVVLA